MKLKSLNKETINTTITLPLVGDVYFDENNMVEIPDNKVDDLLKLQFGIKFEVKEKQEKIEKKVESEDLIQPQPESVLESLQLLSNSELKELLKQYPSEETKDLKKKNQIIDYLITKL